MPGSLFCAASFRLDCSQDVENDTFFNHPRRWLSEKAIKEREAHFRDGLKDDSRKRNKRLVSPQKI